MKYLVFRIDELIKHLQSGVAYTKKDRLERRKMDFTVMLILTKGEYYVKCKEEYHMVKDDVLFLPQGVEHVGIKDSVCDMHWHHLYLPSDVIICEQSDLQDYMLSDTVVLPMLFHLENPKVINVLSYQLEQYSYENKETENVRNALMTAIIYEILLESKKEKAKLYPKRLRSIINYIDNNFQHHHISIKQLSEQFGYNEKYIYRLFKKHLGISPLQYIIKQKLNEARNMVLHDTCTVENIALTLNYENPQYFLKQFKQQFGMTPTEMRQLYSGSDELFLSKE